MQHEDYWRERIVSILERSGSRRAKTNIFKTEDYDRAEQHEEKWRVSVNRTIVWIYSVNTGKKWVKRN